MRSKMTCFAPMTNIRIYKFIFGLAFLVGCTTLPAKDNIISIDRDGELEIPGHTIFGTQKVKEIENHQSNKDPELEYIEKRIDEALKENNKIAIYIHGGLNYPSESVDKANKISKQIQETGYTPIFIDWRSGFWTTYKEHLLHSRQGEYLEVWGPLTAPFTFLEDIGRGVTRAPMRFFQVMNNYGKSILFGEYGGENNASELSKHYLSGDFVNNQCKTNTPSIVNNKYNFGELPKLCDERSLTKKVGDGLLNFGQATLALTTAPIFDTLATSAWSTMKRRTEIMFSKRICYDEDDGCDYRKDSIENYQASKEGAASKFFRILKEKQDKNKNVKVLLLLK
ncbi:hypothetical protein DDY07_07280 [Methylomonas sp. ZR1]|nr:hypothetical protein [Methylomonas sp. ZR1]